MGNFVHVCAGGDPLPLKVNFFFFFLLNINQGLKIKDSGLELSGLGLSGLELGGLELKKHSVQGVYTQTTFPVQLHMWKQNTREK